MAEMLSMGGAVLKVSSEEMYHQAQEAETQLKEIRGSFEQMRTQVQASDRYWQGDAGEIHRTTYVTYQNQAADMFLRLDEHIKDLRLMAAGYENAEKANTSGMEALSSDVIF